MIRSRNFKISLYAVIVSLLINQMNSAFSLTSDIFHVNLSILMSITSFYVATSVGLISVIFGLLAIKTDRLQLLWIVPISINFFLGMLLAFSPFHAQ